MSNKRITDDRIAEIINKGVKEMPSNPASRGYSQDEIRKYFYVPEEEILKEMQGLEEDLADKINKVITEEEKAKLGKIVINGSDSNFLAEDGNYREVPIPQSVTDLISSLEEEVEAKADKVTVDNQLAEKVDKTQMATVNGQSLLNGGNITIEGGGGNVTVDSELSTTSENPVQNKVVTEALNKKVDSYYDDKDMTTQYVYSSEVSNGVRSNKVRRFSSAITGDKQTYFTGSIPTYRGVGGSAEPQLTTGTPAHDFSCVNLKYFNTNKGTKLYKHTVIVTYSDGSDTPKTFDIYFTSTKNVNSVYFDDLFIYINVEGVLGMPYAVSDGDIKAITNIEANAIPEVDTCYSFNASDLSDLEILELTNVEDTWRDVIWFIF